METLHKLQPTRTIHLQGASDFGAAAALHSATETGFKVSGVFRDAADFAVLVLWDRDDFFGHPRFSYLPDGDFSGITLTFDSHYENLQPIDSPKYPTIDWPYLNCLKTDGTLVQLRLFDRATQVGGAYTKAEGAFTLVDNGLQPYDRVTLWYQNIAFDYIVPEFTTSCVQAMWWQGNPDYVHWVRISDATYSCVEDGYSSAEIAQIIAAQINANDPYCEAATGGQYGNEITIRLRAGQNGPVNVSGSDGSAPATLRRITAAIICQAIADQINGFDWQAAGVLSYRRIMLPSSPGRVARMARERKPVLHPARGRASGRIIRRHLAHHDQLLRRGPDGSSENLADVCAAARRLGRLSGAGMGGRLLELDRDRHPGQAGAEGRGT